MQSDCRVLTITGLAGIGKSRFAIELVRSLSERAGCDVFHCDASEATQTAALCDGVASALGMADSVAGTPDAVGRVGKAILARGELILLLDNFDRVARSASETVGRWLEIAPEARFVVTTRERLKLPEETVHELEPLQVPVADSLAGESEAVELFVQCVRKHRQDYTLTLSEGPFVAGIVRVLDGIPLAIKLAAPRLLVMSARALLHRLRAGSEVLARGGAGRHATLDAAIEASWNALETWEQSALGQCTVFRGGFSTEAAEAIIDFGEGAEAHSVLDTLQSLRDKSMLRAWVPAYAAHETRLELFRAVRDFAAQRVDSREVHRIEERHADWFVQRGERWAAGGWDMDGGVQSDRDNLLAIVERVAERQPVTARTAEPALRALLVLAAVAQLHGPSQSWMRVLEPTLDATKDSGADPLLVGRAFALRGALHRM
jgi:predicted ATPase